MGGCWGSTGRTRTRDEGQYFGDILEHIQMYQMNTLPFRHMGVVICRQHPDQACTGTVGSGILISKNLVLTCAHIIYDRGTFRYRKFISFYPKQCGRMTTPVNIKGAYFPQQYFKASSPQHRLYDYALLLLQTPVEETDFIRLCSDVDRLDRNSNLMIYGYPAAKYQKVTIDGQTVTNVDLYGIARDDRLLNILPGKQIMENALTTSPGQSGSPVIRKDQYGVLTIVGIHIGRHTTNRYINSNPPLEDTNIARLITTEVIDNMLNSVSEWSKQCTVDNFKVYSDADEIRRLNALLRQSHIQHQAINPQETTIREEITSQQYFRQGQQQEEKKDYKKAINCFRQVVLIDPYNDRAWNRLGFLFDKEQNYDLSFMCYERTIKLNPNPVPGLQNPYFGLWGALQNGVKQEYIRNSLETISSVYSNHECFAAWQTLRRLHLSLQSTNSS